MSKMPQRCFALILFIEASLLWKCSSLVEFLGARRGDSRKRTAPRGVILKVIWCYAVRNPRRYAVGGISGGAMSQQQHRRGGYGKGM
jgi:hypothetical protein